MVTPVFDYRGTSDMRRVYPTLPDLSEADQRKRDRLEAEYEQLAVAAESAENEEASESIVNRIDAIDAELEALKGEPVYAPEDIARGGAFVTLGQDGGVRVERGFIRKADEPPAPVKTGETEAGGEDDTRESSVALPERLVAQLTAQRTMALQVAVAARPDVAFIAVVHAFAVPMFYSGSPASCLAVSARRQYLSGYAPGIDHSPAGQAMAARHETLAARLPADVDELWDALWLLPHDQLNDLLAYCAALTIDGVVRTGGKSSKALEHAEALVQTVSLDMTQHWQPTKTNYLGQVTKAVIMDAVREGVSPQAADNIASLKKPDMAEAAERLLTETGWLPKVLRLGQPQTPETLAA
jgi:ParB family chromosome partitioning protein